MDSIKRMKERTQHQQFEDDKIIEEEHKNDKVITIPIDKNTINSPVSKFTHATTPTHIPDYPTPTTLENALEQIEQLKDTLRLSNLKISQLDTNKKLNQMIDETYIEEDPNANCLTKCFGTQSLHNMSIHQYLLTPSWRILLIKRLPWLLTLLILQSFSASILHAFQHLLEDHLVLASKKKKMYNETCWDIVTIHFFT
jgi:hypothetical protein